MNTISEKPERRKGGGPTLKSARRLKNLVAALSEINRRSVGLDGIRHEAFLTPLESLRWNPDILLTFPELHPLRTIQESLTYPYSPDPTKLVMIKERPVEVGTVANRLVERAISRKLTNCLDAFFSESSWGFRPGRSPQKAVKKIREAIHGGAHHALKCDIASFFPSIDRGILEAQLEDRLLVDSIREVVLRVTSPVVLTPGGYMERMDGLPQGNGLSPIISSIYLHKFDVSVSAVFVNYYRYADDLLILGQTHQEVEEAKLLIRRLLEALSLQLNEEKTHVLDLYRSSVVFLGYELRGRRVYPPEKAIVRLERKLKLRGQDVSAKLNLMQAFTRYYCIGPVRKMFRRLDRRLVALYPPGATLVGMLDATRAKKTRKPKMAVLVTQLG